ncbi:MAG: response regulator, partial [Bdellovibrionota bacterium]
MITGQKLLLVEDDPTLRQALNRFLGVYNEVRVAPSLKALREILAEAARWDPDVVLLDKGLPDGNGAALIPEVRGRFLESAIVIVTGDEDFNAVGKCLAMGADDYLVKSESFVEDLLIRIPVVLKNREAMRIARSAPKSPALKITLQVTDLTVDSLEQFMRA